MRNGVIVDSGPLIALFDANDLHHKQAVAWFRQTKFVGHTTVAILTEVSHILRFRRQAQLDFLRWIRLGGLRLAHLNEIDLERCIDVMSTYADLPADFADATLVAIAERLDVPRIATFDRDFEVYRYRNRSRFRNLMRL